MIFLELLDHDRISTNLLFFKNRHKYEDGTRPLNSLFVKTHGEKDLCDISDYHQAGTEKTLVFE